MVIPIFLFALFGLIDGGRAVYMNSVVSQAAREGARLGAVEASWIGSTDSSCNTPGGPVCPASQADLKADIVAAANRMVSPFGSIDSGHVYISCDTAGDQPTTNDWPDSGCLQNSPNHVVSVRVQLEYQALTPLISNLIPPVWLSGSATMVIN